MHRLQTLCPFPYRSEPINRTGWQILKQRSSQSKTSTSADLRIFVSWYMSPFKIPISESLVHLRHTHNSHTHCLSTGPKLRTNLERRRTNHAVYDTPEVSPGRPTSHTGEVTVLDVDVRVPQGVGSWNVPTKRYIPPYLPGTLVMEGRSRRVVGGWLVGRLIITP